MKKLFKIFSKKSIPSYISQTYYQPIGKPVWTSREYEQFADEAYVKNVIAHRCIGMVASGASSIKWKLTKNGKEITKHPLLKLLSRPNPTSGGAEFFETVYSYKLIAGNAYILAVSPNNEPKELYTLRPDMVQVIAGKQGIPLGYRYTDGKNHRDYMLDSITGKCAILHLKAFHPLDNWYGLSSIESAAYSIDQHNQAGAWNQALLQNGARPSGALVVKQGEGMDNLSDEQYNRLKNQIDDQYSGASNAGRPILLEGGLDWKEMSLSPKDMDFMNIKNSSARDIALAFGVPPQLLGIPGDNTYSNMAEARLSLWEQTILPFMDNVTDAINNWIVPSFDENLKLEYDKDGISALAPRREAVWNRVKNADFLSDDEKRKMVGI